MSINFTTYFTRLGKIINWIKVVNTHRGTTLPTDTDELLDQYTSDNDAREMVTGVLDALRAYQAGGATITTAARTAAENTLIEMIKADNPQEEDNVEESLKELVTQMEDNSESVDAASVSVTSPATAGSNNVGDGVCLVSVKRGDGLTNELVFDEDLIATCETDSQEGSATAGQETFTIRGESAASDPLSHDYPKGSGTNVSITVIDAAQDSSGNLLTNSDFEDFTTSNTPDNWSLDTGSAGTDFLEETTTVYSGSSSLEFVGDGSTANAISQTFNSSNGTTGTLLGNAHYGVVLWGRVDTAPAAGELTVDLYDGSSVIADEQSNNNSFTVDLTSIGTTFVAKAGIFITPRQLPSTIQLRIYFSSALSNTHSFFLDHVSFAPMTELYDGGVFASIHGGNTAFLIDDIFTLTPTNDYGGELQDWHDRIFGMKSLGLQLPSNSGGSETQADSLIS